MEFIFLSEGMRMFKRKLEVSKQGFKEYSGSPTKICSQIVTDCYNQKKKYFMTSTGHFCEYWSRDFGLCISALKELGYKKDIKNTLEYALNVFQKHNRIATTISPNGKPFDFPTYAPDSLAHTLHSLIVLGDKKLIEKYKELLESEANKFYKKVIDKKTGLVKRKHFSSMKDHTITKSSCYNNVMAAWVSNSLDKLELNNPMKKYNFKKKIKEHFWTGTHFIDDLSGNNIISGDSNTFPFWTGVFDSKEMLKSVIKTMKEKKLDNPFPLKYAIEKPKLAWYDWLAKDYEYQNLWPHLGYPFIEIVSTVDKELAKKYLKKYSEKIKKYKTFLEVYTKEGKPFKTNFYCTDEGMLWAANYLFLEKKLF